MSSIRSCIVSAVESIIRCYIATLREIGNILLETRVIGGCSLGFLECGCLELFGERNDYSLWAGLGGRQCGAPSEDMVKNG